MNETLDTLLSALQGMNPVLRATIAGLAIILETSVLVGLIIPGDTIALMSSLGSQSVSESIILALALITGSLIGESLGFAIGRFLGPRIHHSWLGKRIGEQTWLRAERYIERRGGIAVFTSRFIPVLHSIVPVTVGMSTMSYRRFLSWTIPACVLWASAYVIVGYSAALSYQQLSQSLHWAGYLLVGIVGLFIIVMIIIKRLVHHNEKKHMEE